MSGCEINAEIMGRYVERFRLDAPLTRPEGGKPVGGTLRS
jgi:hypothetical protein